MFKTGDNDLSDAWPSHSTTNKEDMQANLCAPENYSALESPSQTRHKASEEWIPFGKLSAGQMLPLQLSLHDNYQQKGQGMAIGKNWTRDELLLALNLYFRIPFGRQDARAREVVELATILGRTAGSVAMKLNNFTSLDPDENARGVRGLSGASSMDRAIWKELQNDWEQVTAESEALWKERAQSVTVTEQGEHGWDKASPTEKTQPVKVRLAQSFFRKVVLAAYSGRCCITGIPVPQLLIASHILPWSTHPEHRADPRNGLCLSRLHDAAFDQGLITFDEGNRLVLSQKIREHMTLSVMKENFAVYEGKVISTPERFAPGSQYLATHRECIFAA